VWNIIGRMMLQTAALEHQEQENDPLRQPQAQANQQRGHCYVDAMFAELNERPWQSKLKIIIINRTATLTTKMITKCGGN
jgi:hypothetical protein